MKNLSKTRNDKSTMKLETSPVLQHSQYDIIIIGGGINGLTAAASLAEYDFSIALVEKNSIAQRLKKFRDGRGISIAKYSRGILERYNIWPYITKKEVGEIHKIIVKDGDSASQLKFDNQLINNQPLGFLIESDNIIEGLYQKILTHKNITLIEEQECCNISFTKHNVSIHLNDNTIQSTIAVVAEGKNSRIRSLLDLPHKSKDYHQTAIICNISHSLPHKNHAYEHFLPRGPFALLPLQDQHKSSVIWTENSDITKLKLSVKELQQFLQEKCKDTHGDIKIVTKVSYFPLSLSYMRDYFKERAVFIGDCLHSIHPLAGQGYNLSLRDINAITQLFTEYYNLGLDIGSQALLNKFTKQRKKDNFAMISITDGLNKLFSNDISIIQSVRRVGLDLVDNIPTLQKFFMKYAMGKK